MVNPEQHAVDTRAALTSRATEPSSAVVVFAPLIRMTHLQRVFWVYALIAAGIAVFAALRGSNAAYWVAGNAALMGVVFGVGAYLIQRSVARVPRQMFGARGTPLVTNPYMEHVAGWAAYNFVRPSFVWNWSFDRGRRWREVSGAIRGAGTALPATIAEESIRGELEAIPMIADLVEPEFIVPSRPIGKAAFGFLMVSFLLMLGFGIARRNVTFTAVYGILAISTALSAPRLKKWFPALRAEGRAPVAAPGIVRDPKGRRWVRGGAIMVVQRTRSKGPIWVTLLGPEGLRRFPFASPKDEDFITLWQRWNHPNPRPELLSE